MQTLHERYEDWLVKNPTQHGGNVPILVCSLSSSAFADTSLSRFIYHSPFFSSSFFAVAVQVLDGNRDTRTSSEVYADFSEAITNAVRARRGAEAAATPSSKPKVPAAPLTPSAAGKPLPGRELFPDPAAVSVTN